MSGGGMNLEAFLDWALALPDPRFWELHDGEPTQRPASWVEDGLIKTEVLGQLHRAFEDDPAHEFFGPGLLVPVAERTATEPHFTVVPRATLDWDSPVVRDPVVVIEVPRRDARAEHWAPRLRGYAGLPSVLHVVAVHAAARAALHLRRTEAGAVSGRFLRSGIIVLEPFDAVLDVDALWSRLNRRGSGGRLALTTGSRQNGGAPNGLESP